MEQSLNSEFLSHFKCPVCTEFFDIPVFQCDNGHSLCNSCSHKTNACPTCRAPIRRKLRNYLLEQQISSIEIKCAFQGCREQFKMSERLEHEQSCLYSPNLPCILQNCRWNGSRTSLITHLTQKHKIPHYDICGNTAEYSSRLRSSSLPPTAGCVKLLHTFFMAENDTYTILTYIFMDSNNNRFYPQFRSLSNSIKYSLKIWNTEEEDGDELMIVGKAHTIRYSLEEERESKSCIAVDLESLISKFSFKDRLEEGHRLLHYKLKIEPKK